MRKPTKKQLRRAARLLRQCARVLNDVIDEYYCTEADLAEIIAHKFEEAAKEGK